MKYNPVCQLIILGTLVFSFGLQAQAQSLAADQDINAPISISAKSTFVDGVSKMSVYEDDVVIVQAGLTINAARLSINASAGEGQEVFIANGAPAKFTQLLDDGTIVTASAREIRYSVITRTVSFEGDAQLSQNTSVVNSESIEFDLINKQLVAKADNAKGGRVTTVFQPEGLKQQIQEQQDDNN